MISILHFLEALACVLWDITKTIMLTALIVFLLIGLLACANNYNPHPVVDREELEQERKERLLKGMRDDEERRRMIQRMQSIDRRHYDR